MLILSAHYDMPAEVSTNSTESNTDLNVIIGVTVSSVVVLLVLIAIIVMIVSVVFYKSYKKRPRVPEKKPEEVMINYKS